MDDLLISLQVYDTVEIITGSLIYLAIMNRSLYFSIIKNTTKKTSQEDTLETKIGLAAKNENKFQTKGKIDEEIAHFLSNLDYDFREKLNKGCT